MELRYDWSDGGTPDLKLVDRTTWIGERHFDICARGIVSLIRCTGACAPDD